MKYIYMDNPAISKVLSTVQTEDNIIYVQDEG
jgi:hypothetical protein